MNGGVCERHRGAKIYWCNACFFARALPAPPPSHSTNTFASLHRLGVNVTIHAFDTCFEKEQDARSCMPKCPNEASMGVARIISVQVNSLCPLPKCRCTLLL